MVEIDRMARVRHNGAESGHQLPLEGGACAPPFRSGCRHHHQGRRRVAARMHARSSYSTRSPIKNIRARGRIIFLFFQRTARARAENQANQQCHFKSSRCRMEHLGTDSCRGTVPMEPPMPNCSMGHQDSDLDFDDTGHFLRGASCTIAARGSEI